MLLLLPEVAPVGCSPNGTDADTDGSTPVPAAAAATGVPMKPKRAIEEDAAADTPGDAVFCMFYKLTSDQC